VTKTSDVEVTENGEVIATHSGTLADGETYNFSANSSLLRTGTNTVNISVGDGSLSADAPTPATGFEMNHSAKSDRSVQYEGEHFSERYNVSRPWDSATQDATLTIPFAGNVISVRDLTVFVNGTETPPAWSQFKENSTTLEIGFGDLGANSEVRVVTNGSKVVAENATIQVRDPTKTGQKLNSKVELVSWASDSYLAVGGTSNGDWIHYGAAASWSSSADYAHVTVGGSQHLTFPNAADGATVRVRNVPLEVEPQSGGVEVLIVDAAVDTDNDGETEGPEFRIRQGDATGSDNDNVRYDGPWLESTISYELYSTSSGQPVDTDSPNSPVEFLTGDDAMTYLIQEATGGGGGGGGGGDSGDGEDDSSGTATTTSPSPLGSAFVVGVVVVGILAFWYVGRKVTGASGVRDNGLLLVGGGATALVGVSAVSNVSLFGLVADVAATGAGRVVLAAAVLLVLRGIDARTEWIPTWGYVVTGVGLTFWLIQEFTGGALTSSVERTAPVLLFAGIIGTVVILWKAFDKRDIIIGGGRR
jgi:hypothetical protein